MAPEQNDDHDIHDRRRLHDGRTEADVLRRLHELPPEAKFTPEETSIYLNTRRDLLRAWRWQGRGPSFEGQGHFIRYTKQNLDRFMAGHAGHVTAA